MSQIDLKYKPDERLPWRETGLYGLQWFMISVPLVIILGQVGGGIHYPHSPQLQLLYLQKLFLVTGATMLLQLIWGHKLPIIVGPASVLLIGIIANSTTGADNTAVIYSTMALLGLGLSVLGAWGVVGRVTALFTPCISGIVLLLIAFTMLPTVLRFITAGPDFSFTHGVFAFCLLLAILLSHRILPDLLRSTVVIWALLAGSGFYYLGFQPVPPPAVDPVHIGSAWQTLSFTLDIDLSVFISLLFCFIALMANDVGSIQTTANLLNSPAAGKKTKRGLIFTGLGNVLAGMFGVLGPVNYSLSTGLIISSKCASRYPLIAASAAMIVLACSPAVIRAMSYVPPIVVGTVLFYMLCSQISGGLGVLSPYLASFRYETGIVIGMPMLLATCIAFLPASVAETIPLLWRPLLTNGFVVGVIAAIVLERLLLPEKEM